MALRSYTGYSEVGNLQNAFEEVEAFLHLLLDISISGPHKNSSVFAPYLHTQSGFKFLFK